MRKISTIRVFIPVFLALALLFGAWGSASAAFIDDNHNFEGRMGIYRPAGLDAETYHIHKLRQAEVGFAPVKFRAPLIHLEEHVEGGTLTFPSFITYAVFKITQADLKDWEAGNLGIFYLDLDSLTWQPCNAFLVDESPEASSDQTQADTSQADTSQTETSNERSAARLACIATQNTVYGYGTLRSGEQIQMPVQTAAETAPTP